MTQLQVFWFGVTCMAALMVAFEVARVLWRISRKPVRTPTPTEIIAEALRNSPELQRRAAENNAVLHRLRRSG